MDKLKKFIRESRNWAYVPKGGELFKRAAFVLQHTLGIDAGLIIYRKHLFFQNQQFKAYNPWGLQESAEELSRLVAIDDRLLSVDSVIIQDTWHSVDMTNPPWRDMWIRNGIMKVGYFPITAKSKPVGAIILGRKTGDFNDDAETLSLCAMQLSLILEMLSTRRLAEHVSNHDPLTDVLNRRGFVAFVDELNRGTKASYGNHITYGIKHPDEDQAPVNDKSLTTLVLGTLDINDFKLFNDTYGHSHGDTVLKDIANALQEFVQDSGCCARFGGDEFAFIVSTKDSPETVEAQIAACFANHSYAISVGCATLDPSVGWEASYRLADQKLYENKRAYTVGNLLRS